jgi:hypothetical protein
MKVYSTFQQTNKILLLTTDGEECYPFANTLGVVDRYPESSLPQCTIAEWTEDTVCAYLYEGDNTCANRKYQALTYDSDAAAEAAGAVVTHQGGRYVNET